MIHHKHKTTLFQESVRQRIPSGESHTSECLASVDFSSMFSNVFLEKNQEAREALVDAILQVIENLDTSFSIDNNLFKELVSIYNGSQDAGLIYSFSKVVLSFLQNEFLVNSVSNILGSLGFHEKIFSYINEMTDLVLQILEYLIYYSEESCQYSFVIKFPHHLQTQLDPNNPHLQGVVYCISSYSHWYWNLDDDSKRSIDSLIDIFVNFALNQNNNPFLEDVLESLGDLAKYNPYVTAKFINDHKFKEMITFAFNNSLENQKLELIEEFLIFLKKAYTNSDPVEEGAKQGSLLDSLVLPNVKLFIIRFLIEVCGKIGDQNMLSLTTSVLSFVLYSQESVSHGFQLGLPDMMLGYIKKEFAFDTCVGIMRVILALTSCASLDQIQFLMKCGLIDVINENISSMIEHIPFDFTDAIERILLFAEEDKYQSSLKADIFSAEDIVDTLECLTKRNDISYNEYTTLADIAESILSCREIDTEV